MPNNAQTTTVALISYTSKVMLKIFQARLQQYMNLEIPDVQADFRKGRGTRDQIVNIWRGEYFTTLQGLWKILKEMGIPDHLTCLLRNLYAG